MSLKYNNTYSTEQYSARKMENRGSDLLNHAQ